MLAFPPLAAANPAIAAESGPNWAEQGQFWVALAGVVLTVGALIFVWIQVRATRQEGRADRVSALMHRHQEREFLRMRVAALRYIKVDSAEQCFDHLLSWEDAASSETPLFADRAGPDEPVPSMNDCRHVVEYFEEVAGLYNSGAIDIELAARFFPNIIVETLDQYWWLLHEFREGKVGCLQTTRGGRVVVKPPERQDTHETGSYAEWEALARNFYRVKPTLYPPIREDGIWIVCVPREGDDRDAYRALTRTLSCTLGELKALEDALGVDERPPDAVAKRVYCIAPWQMDLDVHRRCQRVARAVEREIEADQTLAAIRSKLYLRPTSSTQVAPPSPHGASAPTPRPPRR